MPEGSTTMSATLEVLTLWPNQAEVSQILDLQPSEVNRATPEAAGVRDGHGRHYPPELFLHVAAQAGISYDWAAARCTRFMRKRLSQDPEAQRQVLAEI